MRLFAGGVVIGFILGAAAASPAAYIGTDRWQQAPNGSIFHLGYVAGVIDTVQALKEASYLTRQTIAEALDAVVKCTASSTLGEVTTRAEAAVADGQSAPNVADVIVLDLVRCQ